RQQLDEWTRSLETTGEQGSDSACDSGHPNPNLNPIPTPRTHRSVPAMSALSVLMAGNWNCYYRRLTIRAFWLRPALFGNRPRRRWKCWNAISTDHRRHYWKNWGGPPHSIPHSNRTRRSHADDTRTHCHRGQPIPPRESRSARTGRLWRRPASMVERTRTPAWRTAYR